MNIVIFQWLTVFLCYRFAAKSTALGEPPRYPIKLYVVSFIALVAHI
jgi:TRAP-type mannitol/chloroaromatic compound transport system permease small subunit